MKVIFREPEPTDAKSLMEFINEIIDEPSSGILMDSKVTLKEEKKWLTDKLDEIKQKRSAMLSLEYKGRIRGNCEVNRYQWKESQKASIGIAISKEMRGKGIGEALMRQTITLALDRIPDIEIFVLSAFEYNKVSLNLYKKLGFEVIGTVPNAIKEGDKYYDEHIMILQIQDKS